MTTGANVTDNTASTVTAGELPLTVVRPAQKPPAAIIVVQEAFGVTSHIDDVAGRVADAGYLAVAPHLFHRTGDPDLAYDNLDAIWPHMAGMSEQGIADDIDATLGWLAGEGFSPENVGIVGFCMGGSVTLWTAANRTLGAAVTFYGGGLAESRFGFPPLIELGAHLKTPWLGLYGEIDAGIPLDQVEKLRLETDRAAVDAEIATFPNADHGFHCDDRPAVFNAAAARDAWSRTLRWFGEYITRR
jgi:carboxymethylenebutenolidase